MDNALDRTAAAELGDETIESVSVGHVDGCDLYSHALLAQCCHLGSDGVG